MPRIHRNSFSIFIGLTGIAIGAFYLAQSFGYLTGFELSDYWPLLLILFGASRIINPHSNSSYFWGPVFIGVGALFMAYNLNQLPFNPAKFWPVILIIVGLWIIVRSLFGLGRCRTSVCGGVSSTAGKYHHKYQAIDSVLNDNELDISLTMSGGKYICTSKEFKGGTIRVRAAGAELDLTSVETSLEEIPLFIDLKLGGIEIRVPQNWIINYKGTTTMGSVQDHTRPPVNPSKKLVISGDLALAGIEIRN